MEKKVNVFKIRKLHLKGNLRKMNDKGCVFAYSAGATRRVIRIIDKNNILTDKTEIENIKISVVKYPNTTYFFINKLEEKQQFDIDIAGLFVGMGYDFTIIRNEIKSAYSSARLESGIISLVNFNGIIKCHSYKNRRPADYFKLVANGFQKVEEYEIDDEIQNLI